MNSEVVSIVLQMLSNKTALALPAAFLFNFSFIKKKKPVKSEFADIQEEQEPTNIKHIDELENLAKLRETPETKLEILDVLAQDFLRKKFHIKKGIEYSELAKFFTEKNKPNISDFCRRMMESMYSGEKLSPDKVDDLITDLTQIIAREDPSQDQFWNRNRDFTARVDKVKILDTYGKRKKEEEEYVGKETKKIIKSKLKNKKRTELKPEDIKIIRLDSPIRGMPIKAEPLPVNQDSSENQNHSENQAPSTNQTIPTDTPQYEENKFGNTALNVLQNPVPISDEEPEEAKNIESIDDLERIRDKLQRNKKIQNTEQ